MFKLTETSCLVAEVFSATDLRHTPVVMIGCNLPVIAVIPSSEARLGMTVPVEGLGERARSLW